MTAFQAGLAVGFVAGALIGVSLFAGIGLWLEARMDRDDRKDFGDWQ